MNKKDDKTGMEELYEIMASHLKGTENYGKPVYFSDKMWICKDGRLISDEEYSSDNY